MSLLSRRTVLAAGSLAALTPLAGCGGRSVEGRVRLAAGEPGGLYLAFAQLLAEQAHRTHPGLVVEVLRTEGSVDNLARVRNGSADLALSLADVAELVEGARSRVALARVYENYLQVIVPDRSPVRELADLRGRRISAGARGSGAAVTSAALLAVAGLRDRVTVVAQPLDAALAVLRAGTLDAAIWSGGVPTPAVAELDRTFGVRLVEIGGLAAGMARASGYDYLSRQVPAVGYAAEGVRTIGVPDLIVCRPDLDDRIAGALVEVLVERASHLVPPYVRGLQYLAPSGMIQTGGIALHPGAAAAYRRLHG